MPALVRALAVPGAHPTSTTGHASGVHPCGWWENGPEMHRDAVLALGPWRSLSGWEAGTPTASSRAQWAKEESTSRACPSSQSTGCPGVPVPDLGQRGWPGQPPGTSLASRASCGPMGGFSRLLAAECGLSLDHKIDLQSCLGGGNTSSIRGSRCRCPYREERVGDSFIPREPLLAACFCWTSVQW